MKNSPPTCIISGNGSTHSFASLVSAITLDEELFDISPLNLPTRKNSRKTLRRNQLSSSFASRNSGCTSKKVSWANLDNASRKGSNSSSTSGIQNASWTLPEDKLNKRAILRRNDNIRLSMTIVEDLASTMNFSVGRKRSAYSLPPVLPRRLSSGKSLKDLNPVIPRRQISRVMLS